MEMKLVTYKSPEAFNIQWYSSATEKWNGLQKSFVNVLKWKIRTSNTDLKFLSEISHEKRRRIWFSKSITRADCVR